MKRTLDNIIAQFSTNLRAVDNLLTFDDALLAYALHSLDTLDQRLKEHGFDNPRYAVDKAISTLKGVREHESIKDRYSMMYNQCVVLEVSHFASTLKTIFTDCLMFAITTKSPNPKLQKETIQISLGELSDLKFDITEHVGELVASKGDISFQDMRSISRAFSAYFGVSIERDENVANIIFAQACRHCIVHSGAVADDRVLRQIEAARGRTVNVQLRKGEPLCFAPQSLRVIAQSMESYVGTLARRLIQVCEKNGSNE